MKVGTKSVDERVSGCEWGEDECECVRISEGEDECGCESVRVSVGGRNGIP